MTPKQNRKNSVALTQAHHDHAKGMNSYSFFKVHDHETSDDLVQDTFTKTWKYLVRGGKIEIMRAFLYHVLNGLIVDEYRKHKTTSLDVLIEKGFEPSVDNSEKLFNLIDGKSAILLIQYLPAKYQKIMRMRYSQNLSLKEISLITGQSKNTTTVQVHRGLEKLKVIYKQRKK